MDEIFEEEFKNIINELGDLHQIAIEMRLYDSANAIYSALKAAQNEYLKLKLN